MAASPAPGLHIGITVGLLRPDEDLWGGSLKQQALFLAEALRGCTRVESVTLLNTTAVPLGPNLPWDTRRWPTRNLVDAVGKMDVLVELGGQVDAAVTQGLHERGAKLVSFCCSPEYLHAMEAMIANRPLWGSSLFVNRGYDAIWAQPQVAPLNAGFFSTLRRKPVQVAPFVWDPVLVEQRCARMPHQGRYVPRPGPKRIAVVEPNIDVSRFCLYPALIADEAFRARPEAIESLRVANCGHIATQSPEFIALMNYLDLVRKHRAFFLDAPGSPEFVAGEADAVVSHAWGPALPHSHLEACWLGYPLVHNAAACGDLGYYYEGHDTGHGASRLLEALSAHDGDVDAYRQNQRDRIARFLPHHPDVTRAYSALLEALMDASP